MDSSPSDFELMAQLRDGARDALAALIRRYQRSLVNFFRRMGARTGECDDLVQETFLRVYAYRTRYAPTGKFSNFLFVLARHVWADMMRKASRTPATAESAVEESTVPSEEGRADARMDITVALATLSEKLRMVVVLNIYQGLKYEEIAEVLDIPLGTVKSRMHLALKQLRERMNAGK